MCGKDWPSKGRGESRECGCLSFESLSGVRNSTLSLTGYRLPEASSASQPQDKTYFSCKEEERGNFKT